MQPPRLIDDLNCQLWVKIMSARSPVFCFWFLFDKTFENQPGDQNATLDDMSTQRRKAPSTTCTLLP